MADKNKSLTKVEEEIMQLIWGQNEPRTVSQLINLMAEPKPPHSTISSIVRILEKKEFVDHKTYGRTHVYFPIVQKKDYTRFSLQRLIGNYFEGSTNELVSFLVKENDLNLKDLGELMEQLEQE